MSNYDNFFKEAAKKDKITISGGTRQKVEKRSAKSSAKELLEKQIANNERENKKTAARNNAITKNKLAKNVKRKTKTSNLRAIGGLLLVLSLAVGGLYYVDGLGDFFSEVEIGYMSKASAEEKDEVKNAEKNSETKVGKAEESSLNSGKGKGIDAGSGKKVTTEIPSHFNKINQRSAELDKREENLVELERDLQRQRVVLDKKIEELKVLRSNIAKVLEEKISLDDKKVSRLVDFYSNMKPQKAAKIFENINEDLAVEVLSKMKKKNAASIMNLLNAAKARKLSEKFAGYNL